VPRSDVRRLPTTLRPALERLHARRDELTKAWLVGMLERASIDEIAQLPTDRIARETPAILAAVLDLAAAPEDAGPAALPAEGVAGAAALAELRHAAGGSAADLVADVGALQALAIADVRREVGDDAHLLGISVERLAAAFCALQAEAVEQLVSRRAQELERLANTDDLTGLYNVRFLRERLRALQDEHGRYGHPFALLLLDIDGLKRLNDSRGHAAGDAALVAVAEALRAHLRAVDTAIRVGGDEFCVLAPQQTAARATILAQRIARALETGAEDGPAVGVSIGVVSCPQHGSEPDALLELADAAMYRAKASGDRIALGDAPARSAAGAKVR
jgi:diguanylate cyclase (GGDEF)-like protein